jgi:ribonuclease-3
MITIKELNIFEKEIGFNFKKKENLINTMIHPSYIGEKNNKKKIIINHFERLEFLGDRVLGLIISNLIYNIFPDFNEGDLTKKLSYLVQKKFLYKIALELKLDKILKFSSKKENERMNVAILSDAVESLIGSIYIDSGYNSAFKYIKKIWGPYLNLEASNEQDSKTELQEIFQQKTKKLPEYKVIKKEGPPHSPFFTVSLKVFDLNLIKAKGKSKREAEKNAASKALKLLNE